MVENNLLLVMHEPDLNGQCLNGMGHESLDFLICSPTSRTPHHCSEHGSPAGPSIPELTQLLICRNNQVPIEISHHSFMSYYASLAVPNSEKSPCGSAPLPWKHSLSSLDHSPM